jgi:LacI family transcriptional regulator, repressor for deo operon, udp, cdd, tsx, nupC, and nupG
VQYLLNRGHTRIALVNSDERFLYAQQRRLGYEAALSRAGAPSNAGRTRARGANGAARARARGAIDPSLILTTGENSYAAGAQAAVTLLTLPNPPTAVFAVSDTLAIGVIKGLRRAGRRVPDDVAVVGFDDLPIAEVFEPGLTTVAQPMPELGAAAVDMLLARMAGEHPAHRVLPHRLVLRQSA